MFKYFAATYLGKSEKISGIDGIRGFAFLIVFVLHIVSLNATVAVGMVGLPKVGVWLFFVLSSFLLTNYFISQPEKCKQPREWMNYIVRRFLRIYPLFVLVVFIYYLFNYYVLSSDSLIRHFLLKEGSYHFWTMPVEIKYYFVLPLVVICMVYIFRLNLKVSLIALALITAVHQYYFPYTHSARESVSLIQYLPVFLMGSTTALVYQKLKNAKVSNDIRLCLRIFALIILVSIFLSAKGIVNLFIDVPKDYLLNKYLHFGFAWCLFILCVLIGGGAIKKVFEWKFLRFLGSISYSGYLIHPIFIAVAIKHFGGLNVLSLLFIVFSTFSSAFILNKLIERPLMKISLIQRQFNNLHTGIENYNVRKGR